MVNLNFPAKSVALEARAPRVSSDVAPAGAGVRFFETISGATNSKAAVARAPFDPSTFRDVARTILPVEFRGREVKFEAHAYEDDSASFQAMALVRNIANGKTEVPIVRVHSGCVTGDIFHSLRCDCYQQLQKSLELLVASHKGAIIYLPHHEGRGIGLVNKIKAYAEQDRGLDTVDANLSIGAPVDARDYELAAKILKDLGFDQIRLMTNNPLKVEALGEHGIKVVERVEMVTTPSPHNERYLATKRQRMAHKL
jgi:GTP cyclohydrolase II/3,4-dihydroxy 2-butanone 4-phosphate synthase/GTP cyclohydrolase II